MTPLVDLKKKTRAGGYAQISGCYVVYLLCYSSAQFLGESLWPAVVLKVWDTLNIHSSVACDHTGFSK